MKNDKNKKKNGTEISIGKDFEFKDKKKTNIWQIKKGYVTFRKIKS